MILKTFLIAAFIAGFFIPQTHAAEPLTVLKTSELRDFEKLEPSRQELIETALRAAKPVAGMPYKFGGNGAKDGGFDCSGAMHHVLHEIGLKPPRTSYDQYLWIKEHSEFHTVPEEATDITHESFSELKPGDLVFWTGTYQPTDGRPFNISHVAIFLGYEMKGDHPVMINATNGRSYRGKKGNGYGVYDFRVPSAASKSRIIGYGKPPFGSK